MKLLNWIHPLTLRVGVDKHTDGSITKVGNSVSVSTSHLKQTLLNFLNFKTF